MPTVSDIWATADWHERETFDMCGVTFTGHPDLRRILLAEDWEGYPLAKGLRVPAGVPRDSVPVSVSSSLHFGLHESLRDRLIPIVNACLKVAA